MRCKYFAEATPPEVPLDISLLVGLQDLFQARNVAGGKSVDIWRCEGAVTKKNKVMICFEQKTDNAYVYFPPGICSVWFIEDALFVIIIASAI